MFLFLVLSQCGRAWVHLPCSLSVWMCMFSSSLFSLSVDVHVFVFLVLSQCGRACVHLPSSLSVVRMCM